MPFGTKPGRLFLDELLPSRAHLRFIDDAKVQTVSHTDKSDIKFDHYFCPLENMSSEKPLFLSITPIFVRYIRFSAIIISRTHAILCLCQLLCVNLQGKKRSGSLT